MGLLMKVGTTSEGQSLLQQLQQCPGIKLPERELERLSKYVSDSQAQLGDGSTPDTRLSQCVKRRSQGEPLEYILGSTPWAGLDILCRSGTLIPRGDTEMVATNLAKALVRLQSEEVIKPTVPVRIADVGTGTGCISLLLHSALNPPRLTHDNVQRLEILGGDISSDCLKLASDNLDHHLKLQLVAPKAKDDISFQYLDMLKLGAAVDGSVSSDAVSTSFLKHEWDVMISYPPCVPAVDFLPGGRVPYTDRTYQPKLAIVPPAMADEEIEKLQVNPADVFYYILLKVALKADLKLTVLEVMEGPQATRVLKLATQMMPHHAWIERWRDETVFSGEGLVDSDRLDPNDGITHGRAIVIWMDDWAGWRRNK